MFTDFKHPEPNNAGNEDCLEIDAEGKWNDNQCSKPYSYFCQDKRGEIICQYTLARRS